jgi:hypothetical protein
MEQERIPDMLDYSPDAWRMVNVTGVEHKDARDYLRAVFATGKLLHAAQERDRELQRLQRAIRDPTYTSVAIAPMWNGDVYRGFFHEVMAYRYAKGKKPTFFLIHKTPRDRSPGVIFQSRPQRGWSGTDTPFFLFARNLDPAERDGLKRMFQPPVRPLKADSPKDVLATWWRHEYLIHPNNGDAMERLERTYNLIEPVMPKVPEVCEKRYFKATRHSGFLRTVMHTIQRHALEYRRNADWYRTARWSGNYVVPLLKHVAGEKRLPHIEKFLTRLGLQKEEFEAGIADHNQQLVGLTSDLLDAAEAAVPDMYKHDQEEGT